MFVSLAVVEVNYLPAYPARMGFRIHIRIERIHNYFATAESQVKRIRRERIAHEIRAKVGQDVRRISRICLSRSLGGRDADWCAADL